MGSTAKMYTASDAFFEELWEAGVTHCFVNLGSDHPSMLEAMARAHNEKSTKFPRIITCPNEMVALSMADGFARRSGKPQCVIVHVDVGTSGMGAAIHNACTGRAPVLIFAGLSPFTLEGEMKGSRTEFIHWLQDIPDQKQIVSQYCRFTGEIKTGKNVKQMVRRALSFATSDPKGPVYLMGAREVMEEKIEPYYLAPEHWSSIEVSALTESAVATIANELVAAQRPLVVTGYSGRNHATPALLVKLADLVKGLRILDTGVCDMCFPADHPGWLGSKYGNDQSIREADVILVIDCDVPWINTQCQPSEKARIFHIDVDPLKEKMPLFYINAMQRFRVDSNTALNQICSYLRSSQELMAKVGSSDFEDRAMSIQKSHKQKIDSLNDVATRITDNRISTAYLCSRLRELVPADNIYVIEAITNTLIISDQIRATQPGQWLNCGGGGLGWSGGAALGIKMAADAADGVTTPGKGKFIVTIAGDGTFMFSVPSSVYWISHRYQIPILSIVLNNKGWNAPRNSMLLVHPDGVGSRASNSELNISFDPTPDYSGIAKAASSGNIFGAKVLAADSLDSVLKEAIGAVQGGRSAVLDVWIG